jgi:serine/threonine-protein kinase
MPLITPADLAAVSALLDHALDLPAAEREAWLAALPPEHQRHAPALRAMLAERDATSGDAFLASGPRLAGDDAVAHAGDRVGPYRLLREIGRGGMGSVWLAERADRSFQRQVALKLPRLAWGAGLAERMARERDIGARLEHPGIARLYDAGLDERGRPYLALEFIDGQPIDAWCEAQGLGVPQRLRLFVQVVKAVAYAHGRLVVHRDLKPSNVLVTPDGQAHLLDFGIAKLLQDEAGPALTQEQGRVLTPHYASPEQVAGEAITVQSDVYSLGVLLYELLTGTLPYEARRNTLGAIEEAILQGDAPLASGRVKDRAVARALRGEIDAILGKAMQREASRRYATADAMVQDIERHLDGETVSARPDSLGYRLRKGLRRHWIGVAATTAVLLAVFSGAGVAVVQAQRAAQSAERERVVKGFVADVFRIGSRPDPRNTALRPASAQSLIEGGAQLIEQRFAGQPELQAELFGVVGGIFSDMGAYRQASDYASRQVEALALVRADKADQARALLRLAQALADDERYADAEPRVRRVLEQADADSALAAEAGILHSRILLARGHTEEARAALEAVESWLRRQGESPSLIQARALEMRGRYQNMQNQIEESFATLQRAVDVAIAVEGRLSLVAVRTQLFVAHRRSVSTRDDLARASFEAAIAVLRELGGVHAVHASMEAAFFAYRRKAAFNHGTLSEAEATIETSRQALAALPYPVPELLPRRLDFWQGSLRSRWGYVDTGLPLLESSAPTVLALSQSTEERSRILGVMGVALAMAGRQEAADAALREALRLRLLTLDKRPYWIGMYRLIAENLRMAGDHSGAEAVLDSVPPVEAITGEGGSNPNRYRRFINWARAELLLDRGQMAAASTLLAAHPAIEGELTNDIADFEGLMGRAQCGSGQPAKGLPRLRRSLDFWAHREGFSPNHPNVAELRAEVGLCALSAGQRALAIESARQARAAFTAQPGVSPYYKAPLFKLERALGWRLPPV